MTVPDDAAAIRAELAAVLAAANDPAALLPAVLPCAPLDLLIELHAVVTGSILSDLAKAGRAAAAAQVVAARFPEDALLQAQARWTHGTAVLYIPDYACALADYDAALRAYDCACKQLAPAIPERDVRIVHVVRVACLSELGRYHEAQQAAIAAEQWLSEHPHDYARLTLLLNQSQLAGNMGAYVEMVNVADAMIALATALNATARLAQGWINRAYACTFLGRFHEAEKALDAAIATATRAQEPLTVARAQWNRARLLRCQGRLFDALQVLREAQGGLAQAAGEAATVALEEACIYERLRQLSDAQQAAQRAAERYAELEMPAYSAGAYLQAATVAIQQQRRSTARRLLDRARPQLDQADLAQLRAQAAVVEAELAALPDDMVPFAPSARQRRIARRQAQQAAAVLGASGLVQEAARAQLVSAALASELGDDAAALALYRSLLHQTAPSVQLAAHAGLGAALPPAEGLAYLQHAAKLTVDQRRRLPMEELQARYSSETSPHHLRLAACCLELNDVVGALHSVWAAKAGPILDLRAAAATLDRTTDEALRAYKMELARWRAQADDQRREAQHALQQQLMERAAYFTQQAELAEAAVQTTEHALTAALRVLDDRGGFAEVPTVPELQAALPDGTALLEYAERDDALICFVVRPEHDVECRVLGDTRALERLVDRWMLVCRRLMCDPQATDAAAQIAAALAPLCELLVQPLADVVEHSPDVLIAPWGIMHHVPWAALIANLAHRHIPGLITLTPCGALWAATADLSNAAPGAPRLLGYAGSGARHLPCVGEELAAIAHHLPHAQVCLDATAADLRETPPPRVLHLAAHALTNPVAPVCSTIELADGPFLLLEAHRLNLRGTQLVVLSACETSVRPDYGDMALALAGAFLCAGARAVLASLWQVSDAATAALMDRFYAAVAGGVSPAAALGRAQQEMRAAYPLDWAAFQLWAAAA